MADMIDFLDMSPVHSGGAAPADKEEKPHTIAEDFDPLMGSGPTSTSSAVPAPAAGQSGLGMPDAIAKAFAAAAAGGGATGSENKEYLPSGLSVEGQAELMRQIEESAKQMSKEHGDDAKTGPKQVSSAEFSAAETAA